MAVFRHGDDFVICGTRAQQAEFNSELGQHFIVKQLAILALPGVGERARGAHLEPAGKVDEGALRQWGRGMRS